MTERDTVARIILLDVMRSRGVTDLCCVGCKKLAECKDFKESMNRDQSITMCADFQGVTDERFPECSFCRNRYTTDKYDFCRVGICSERHRRFIRFMVEKRKWGKI